jgi:hypothetical protein
MLLIKRSHIVNITVVTMVAADLSQCLNSCCHYYSASCLFREGRFYTVPLFLLDVIKYNEVPGSRSIDKMRCSVFGYVVAR